MRISIIHPKPGARAFTLMEILIASTIMVILLVCIHSAFFAALRLRQSTMDSIDASLPVEAALQSVQRDLANLVTSTNGVFFGPLQTTNPTNALPGQIGPDFYVTDADLNGMVPWGNVQKIDYLLTTPTNGAPPGPGLALVRAVTHNLLPVNGIPAPDEERTLLTGVQNLTFLYYDGAQWDPAWDTTQQTNLPLAIKVQIQMAHRPADGAALEPPLELVVPVDVMLNTNAITPVSS